MKGQSSADDRTALGGSLTEARLFLPPSVMACARGIAPSFPVTAGASAAPPSPGGALLWLLLFPMLQTGRTADGRADDIAHVSSNHCTALSS